MRTMLLAALMGMTTSGALAQQPSIFAEATETVPELIELYEAADSHCRLSGSRDVQIAVARHARSIYGVALNERGWCYGREMEANADMKWHQCEVHSMLFPLLDFEVW